MEIKTHKKIDKSLCGIPVLVEEGRAVVRLKVDERMIADEKGLVHGGFIFGLADYCAMLTVNEPTVVLAGANVKFLKPVVLGDEIEAEGRLVESKGKKKKVEVEVKKGEELVFKGEFFCVVPEKHVLEMN